METVGVEITRQEGFRFRIRFDGDGIADLITDESPPLGQGAGPNPARLLAAAIGNCLAASLLYCLEKAHLEVAGLQAQVQMTLDRNAQGRLRIQQVSVRLAPALTPGAKARMGRCLDLFESFCTVTESVRHGIDVQVAVEPTASA